MAARDEILAHADELLDLASFEDYGPMGLQVVGAADVERIACGVSASRELFERAAAGWWARSRSSSRTGPRRWSESRSARAARPATCATRPPRGTTCS